VLSNFLYCCGIRHSYTMQQMMREKSALPKFSIIKEGVPRAVAHALHVGKNYKQWALSVMSQRIFTRGGSLHTGERVPPWKIRPTSTIRKDESSNPKSIVLIASSIVSVSECSASGYLWKPMQQRKAIFPRPMDTVKSSLESPLGQGRRRVASRRVVSRRVAANPSASIPRERKRNWTTSRLTSLPFF